MFHLRKANPNLVFILIAFGVPWSVQIFTALKRIPLISGMAGLDRREQFLQRGWICGRLLSIGMGWSHAARPPLCLVSGFERLVGLYASCLLRYRECFATLACGLVHGAVGPLRLSALANQWWLPFTLFFGFIFGPLGEEAGWRGYLLPDL